MVPEGAAGIIAFMVFIAPGALFELIVARARPRPSDTTFREINRVVLSSVVASVGAVALVMLPRVWVPGWQQALVEAVRVGEDHWRANVDDVVRGSLLIVGAALTLAVVLALLRIGLGTGGTNYDESQWFLVFRRKRPKDSKPYIIAVSSSGERHFGDLVAYSIDQIDPSVRDITLGAPIHWMPDVNSPPRLLRNVQRLVLSGEQAAQVHVIYREVKPESQL